jgi:hypothetical protein
MTPRLVLRDAFKLPSLITALRRAVAKVLFFTCLGLGLLALVVGRRFAS